MPKGVEHNAQRSTTTPRSPVELPLMPKGVEHYLPLGYTLQG